MSTPSSDLPPLWWVAGLAPHERTADGSPPAVPAWAAWIEQALANHRAGALPDVHAEPRFAELAVPLRPLVEHAWEQVVRAIATADGLDVDRIGATFTDQLAGRLAALAARTLVTELHAARTRKELAGQTPRERFVDFLRQCSDVWRLGELCTRYPVLARLLGQACAHDVEYQVELLGRFATDRTMIVGELLHGADPGPLVAIEAGAGDTHQRGRSVAVLRFAGGDRLMYKPRGQRVQELFGELVSWFNTKLADQLQLRLAAALPRPSYGWLEFIDYRTCADLDQVDRFYRRLGALLALLYSVEATDVHYQNLIACGDHPVLIDVETVFHPQLPPAMIADPDPALAALDSSVYRTALLPQFQLGDHGTVDLSGMGGDPGQVFAGDQVRWESVGTDRMRVIREPAPIDGAANRPTLTGEDIEPAEYLASLLDGFRAGYQVLLAHRDELLGAQGLLRRFASCETRLLNHSTQLYATLLSESTHPDLLRDGLTRDHVFDLLRQDAANRFVARSLVPDEIADLWAGDVPLFTTRPDSRDIWTSTGRNLPNLLDEPGLVAAHRKTAGLSELDRRRQEWLITAAVSARTQVASVHHSGAGIDCPPAALAPDPERLLVEACGIADEILAMAVHDDRRANWVGMELVDGRHWAVQPLGAGLANGYTGVAVFLAQLGALTGAARYTELAREAIRSLPNLIEAMVAKPEIARAVGPGGFLGLGGIGYALSRMASLDGDSGSADCLAAVIELVAGCADDDQADLTFGRAGGLAAMRAVYEETGIAAAGRVAQLLADRLVALPELATAPGFATGPAGVAFALARFDPGAGPALAKARMMSLHGPDSTNYAWCTGLAGTLVAQAALARHEPGVHRHEEIDRTVAALGRRPPIRDMSLCHGELGVLDALAMLATGGHRDARELLGEHVARIHTMLTKYGPRCGTPNAVPSPGLLTGLAGIGYGLLRLGFPELLPSVLAFETNSSRKELGRCRP